MYRSRDIDLHRLPQISQSKKIVENYFFDKIYFFFIFSNNWKSWLPNARKIIVFDAAVQK
jgi:hypothetical protein